jgi:hypothetical protein
MKYDMPEQEDAIIFAVAPDHLWFENWCLIDCDPPLNPRDRRWRVITSPHTRASRGRYKRDGDDVILLGMPTWRIGDVIHVLLSCGFTDALECLHGLDEGRRVKL